MNIKSDSIVSRYWGNPPNNQILGWQSHPYIKSYINRRITGNPNKGMMSYLKDKWFNSPAELALTIGCGFGVFERAAIKNEIVNKIHGVDISENAIKSSLLKVELEGFSDRVTYAVDDCNAIELRESSIDACFGMGSIHHISNLENLFLQINRALKPNGIFCMNEYIGPNRFKSSDTVIDLINCFLRSIPDFKRKMINNTNIIKSNWQPPSQDWFAKFDPSEAVRSEEIFSVVKIYFDVLEFRPFGGSILHHLLSGIAGNFDEKSLDDRLFLDMVCEMELLLERENLIKSDFAIIVCKPKKL